MIHRHTVRRSSAMMIAHVTGQACSSREQEEGNPESRGRNERFDWKQIDAAAGGGGAGRRRRPGGGLGEGRLRQHGAGRQAGWGKRVCAVLPVSLSSPVSSFCLSFSTPLLPFSRTQYHPAPCFTVAEPFLTLTPAAVLPFKLEEQAHLYLFKHLSHHLRRKKRRN